MHLPQYIYVCILHKIYMHTNFAIEARYRVQQYVQLQLVYMYIIQQSNLMGSLLITYDFLYILNNNSR